MTPPRKKTERSPLRLIIVPGAWRSPLELRLTWPTLRKLGWLAGGALLLFIAMGGLSAFSGAQFARWRLTLRENADLRSRNEALTREVAENETRLMAAEENVRRLAEIAKINPETLAPAGGVTVPMTGTSPAHAEAAYPPPPDEPVERAGFLNLKLMRLANALPLVETALVRRQSLLDGRPSGMPVDGTLTNSYGMRMDPFSGEPGFHEGIDISAPSGAWIKSTGDGVVTFAGWRSGFGNVVEITHFGDFLTRYAHLSTIRVPVGGKVKRGQVIGLVGSTGRSTGPHCHYEVLKNGRIENPARYFGPPELK